jgi:hypothetical protein
MQTKVVSLKAVGYPAPLQQLKVRVWILLWLGASWGCPGEERRSARVRYWIH